MEKNQSFSIKAEGSVLIVSILDVITLEMAESVCAQITAMIGKNVESVVVEIDSIGGSVIAANKIALALDKLPVQPDCRIGAICASAATYLALKCNKRTMASNGLVMIHKPMTSFQGNADSMRSQLKSLEIITKDYRRLYARELGKSEKEIDELWKEEWWMDATEAKRIGFITEIQDPIRVTRQMVSSLKATGCPTDIYQRFAAQLTSTQTSEHNSMKREILIAALGNSVQGLTALGENASEADFAKAIQSALTEKDNKIKELNEKIEADQNSQITATLDAAVKDGRITAEDKPKWENLLKADYTSASETLNGLAKRIDINGSINRNNPAETKATGRDDWDYTKWSKEDPKGLGRMRQEDPDKFNALFKEKFGQEPDVH